MRKYKCIVCGRIFHSSTGVCTIGRLISLPNVIDMCRGEGIDITTIEGMREKNKPQLGIIPRYIWLEKRLEEIEKAIYRRSYLSGNVPTNIPIEWIEERNQLVELILKERNEKETKKPPRPTSECNTKC